MTTAAPIAPAPLATTEPAVPLTPEPTAPLTLAQKMDAGQFVLTMELVPPRVPELKGMIDRLHKFFTGHCDAVNVTDCASALLRMSSPMASLVCLREGAEPVMQVTCRDRNRLAIQADLIGAYAMGIRNVLCLTGDHIRFGDHPEAKAVFDLDSTNLIAILSQMRRDGTYASGEPAQATPKSAVVKFDWLIGGAANPCGNDPHHLAAHMDKKCQAGADFLQTQPVFDVAAFKAWWAAMEQHDLPRRLRVLPGILPPKSAKGMEFMRDNVPGMRVPEACIKRLQGAEKPDEEGKRMTLEIVDQLLELPIAGFHLYPVYWEAVMPELAAAIRERVKRRNAACKMQNA